METVWYVIERPLKLVFWGIVLTAITLSPFIQINGMNLIQYLLQ
ncbi:hypothetical protein [Metabacillus endolithicus]|uniref:Uncharacterized protein n=1 Tax=Metabacillus endolithicus TaxID=1535204 RepID=A0ABW5C2L3_9BACI|nr:hypothetical protein [Metabacillus endolithicus]